MKSSPTVPEHILKAITSFYETDTPLNLGRRRTLEILCAKKRGSDPSPDETQIPILTPREFEVFTLLVRGNSSRTIGDELGISERTVEVHRRNLLKKLGVRQSAGLLLAAIEYGILM